MLPATQISENIDLDTDYDFYEMLRKHSLDLHPLTLTTLQVNITKLCNQACHHCHVEASPHRTEQMDRKTMERCLEVLGRYESIETLDITGGAPELNPHFNDFVKGARRLQKHVMVRHNLTVTLDGHPQTEEKKLDLPRFFAEHQVEVISSLPYYQSYFTDKQRGKGVFEKSLASIKLLNEQGYGREGSGLVLNLVYNPAGAFLPAPQANLEADFKRELFSKYGLVFNHLYTLTNMPINRFRMQLESNHGLEDYMAKLLSAFNPWAAQRIMCRSLVNVGYDGRLYDCDFNQMLGMQILEKGPRTLENFDLEDLIHRKILFKSHCFGCTAGSGSSCGGATAT